MKGRIGRPTFGIVHIPMQENPGQATHRLEVSLAHPRKEDQNIFIIDIKPVGSTLPQPRQIRKNNKTR